MQTNIVRQDGRRSALLTVIKKGDASTLSVIKQLKALLPGIRAAAPPGLEVRELFDQSIFVRAAIAGVLTEGAIAAALTGLMILLFLGSWRSTLIVIVSIPLSILSSLILLSALGQTLNVMTLGGLALAVGILVDDATVEIENIHRNLGQGKQLVQAILDGAAQIATPAFVSTLSICIVFVPVVFLVGPAKYLCTPLGMAVVFAMLASYLLSSRPGPTRPSRARPPTASAGSSRAGSWPTRTPTRSAPGWPRPRPPPRRPRRTWTRCRRTSPRSRRASRRPGRT